MQQIENTESNKKSPELERLLICKTNLVRQLDCYWNRLCSSLYLLQEKLADIGIAIVNDEVVYISEKENADV